MAHREIILFGKGIAHDGENIQKGLGNTKSIIPPRTLRTRCGEPTTTIRFSRLNGTTSQYIPTRHRTSHGALGRAWNARYPSHRRCDDEEYRSVACLR